ncbi:MAG TPA: hypothetical protein VF789_19235 [Thermoanaerobaculia bacterium]
MAKWTRGCQGLAVALSAVCALAAPGDAVAQERWKFSLMPYLWLPSMDGNLRFGSPPAGGSAPNISVDADTLLGALDFAFMINAEARKGRWLAATDLIALDLSSDSSHVKSIDFNPGSGPVNVTNTSLDLATESDLKGIVWTLLGGYSVVHSPDATFNVLGGFRSADLEATTDWVLSATVAGPVGSAAFARTGSVKKSTSLLDGIVGVSGRAKLGSGKWFLAYHLDVGGGDSKLTWQGVAGAGYSYKWGDLLLAYRYLSYETSGNDLVEDLKLAGVGLGANFRF